MKKLVFLATSLLLSVICFASQTELVNDKYCVYLINVGDQTARVLNFYSTASSVTIPSSFVYQGDKYVVTSIGYHDFQTQVLEDGLGNVEILSYGKYTFEDYDKNRACIVELNLPNTLTEISWSAFKGMTRLKTLRVPSKVKDFTISCFGDNMRLESVTFEGLPHVAHEYYVGVWPRGSWVKLYLDESDNPVAVLDSLQLTEKIREKCPRLKTIEFLPIKEYVQYKNKLDKTYQVYSQQLKDTLNKYTQMLMSHPYYLEDNYFKGITLTAPQLRAKGVRENYALQISALKEDYNKQLSICKENYSISMRDMENICKRKNPELYAEKYCALHPDFAEQINIMLDDYKCKYSKNQLAKLVLLKYNLGEKCQDELWKQYSKLYKDKESFLSQYTLSQDIKSAIAKREKIYNTFKNQIRDIPIATKGFYDLGDSKHPIVTQNFRHNYDEMRKYGIPVSKEIIIQDPKAQKEFEKNGKFFDSPDDFFAAYITSNYVSILKAKKKAKK